jgi:DnaJ-domain-containing protein 1
MSGLDHLSSLSFQHLATSTSSNAEAKIFLQHAARRSAAVGMHHERLEEEIMHKKFNLTPIDAFWVITLFCTAVALACCGYAIAAFLIVTALAAFVMYMMRSLITSLEQDVATSAVNEVKTAGLFADIRAAAAVARGHIDELSFKNTVLRTENAELKIKIVQLETALNIARARAGYGFGGGNKGSTNAGKGPAGERTYYDVLAVARDASPEDIKSAFRKLAMACHPDRHPGDKQKEEQFKELNEAHEVLKDPQKRAYYDRFGEAPKPR